MKRSGGFTLVELLVVVGIIAVIMGMLLPSLSRAQLSAKQVRGMSDLRQMLTGYTQYHTENRGSVLYGYAPRTVNGKLVLVELPSGEKVGYPISDRYPWRLAPYVADVWRIIHSHTDLPPIPEAADSSDVAIRKAYTLSVNPTYGINSVYVGGHLGPVFEGFVGPEGDTPNTGAHVVFKAGEVRNPSRLIVFAECQARNAPGLISNSSGLHYLTPPHANRKWWSVGDDGKFKLEVPAGVLVGLPEGRNGKRTVTGFFDGHVEAMLPGELTDMRLWANGATSPDYDFH